jgi:hypothetical protein
MCVQLFFLYFLEKRLSHLINSKSSPKNLPCPLFTKEGEAMHDVYMFFKEKAFQSTVCKFSDMLYNLTCFINKEGTGEIITG